MSRSFHDRLADLARPPEPLKPDLVDIERRVGRRKGRKRLGSGVAAALIALASTAFLIRAFDQPSPQVPVGTPSPMPAHLQAKVVDQFDVGPFPQAIAVGEGGVWVVTSTQNLSEEVVRIDPNTNQVVARIPIPAGVADIAAGDGSVWVAIVDKTQGNKLALQTLEIDPGTNRVVQIIPGVGGQVAIGDGYVWALAAGPDETTTTLVRIDPATGTVVSRTTLFAPAADIGIDGNEVWALIVPDPNSHDGGGGSTPDYGGGGNVWTLNQIDALTGQVTDAPSVSASDAPVFADGVMYVPRCCSDNIVSLAPLDPASYEPVGDPIDVGQGLPFGSAFGNVLMMSERGALSALNPSATSVDHLAASDWPAAHGTVVYDADSGSVWVANYKQTVTRIDLSPVADVNATASGYWIRFPGAPQPVADSSGAVRIVASTNLPEGTLVMVNTERSGECCIAVTDGQIVVQESSGACDQVSGTHAPGTSIKLTTTADIGSHIYGVPVGGQPPRQPESVLATLGPHFENLTGDQVVETAGAKSLVASKSYAWPQPLCLEG